MRLKCLNTILAGMRRVLEGNGLKIRDQIEFELSLLEVCNGTERQLILFIGLIIATFLGTHSKSVFVGVVTRLS